MALYRSLTDLKGFSSSVGKESACNAGDLGSIPGLGRSPGEGNGNPTLVFLSGEPPWTEEPGGLQSVGHKESDRTERLMVSLWGFPDSSAGGESTCNAGDPNSIPGSGRSPGEGIGYPLQYHGIPWWLRWERICLQCGRSGLDPWVGKIPWRREWLLTPVFWPIQSMEVSGLIHGSSAG